MVKRITIKILPILQDNYVPLLHDEETGETAVVDPGVSDEILRQLQAKNWQLTHIFLTHHHHDHIGGVEALVQATGAKVIGYLLDEHRLPVLDMKVQGGDKLHWAGAQMQVMFLPGHTTGHIAYYMPELHALFCGDVLFLMGCGRLFEGTHEQMFDSLGQIKALPEETKIYCAHEYTQRNGEFALEMEPENEALQRRMQRVGQLRAAGESTVPGLLAEELQTNPFLRAENLEKFTRLREARNQWL